MILPQIVFGITYLEARISKAIAFELNTIGKTTARRNCLAVCVNSLRSDSTHFSYQRISWTD